jgi:hypothetical protein
MAEQCSMKLELELVMKKYKLMFAVDFRFTSVCGFTMRQDPAGY